MKLIEIIIIVCYNEAAQSTVLN